MRPARLLVKPARPCARPRSRTILIARGTGRGPRCGARGNSFCAFVVLSGESEYPECVAATCSDAPRGRSFSNGPCVCHLFGKRIQGSNVTTGTIKKVVSDRGFGFIAAEDGKEYFFHRGGLVAPLDFDRLAGGERVSFEVETSPKGPRAIQVSAA